MKKWMILLLASGLSAQTVTNDYFEGLKWRCIGPFRASRTVGAVGVPQQPNVFYMGVNNGGVWKTNDYGRTWNPIFDDQPTGSIGDVAVSPSNPTVLYVGSGEGLHRPDLCIGDGIYKSTDGGKHWVNTGIRDGQQIGGLAIDPTDENRVFAAVLGHPYGPNEERGVFRTTNGGKTWERVFYIDENTGAIQVAIDPVDRNVIYADLWEAREGPWENAAWQGNASGLYKSIDGGSSWKKLSKGLPTFEQGLGRIGFDISRTDPKRMYATVEASEGYGGIYRSEDAGASWRKLTDDHRLWGRGNDFGEIRVHPNNPDIVFVANVAAWKSTDGGETWFGIRGAPGGDDYHRIWINPLQPDIMIFAADQGAIITVNGGETFSSWYNQPTAQFYHVSTDNQFPYNVYGGQQESGSAMVSSRSNDGQITFRDWRPVGAEEYGYIAVDPLNPDLIYGGKITRFDKKTGQTQSIEPEPRGKYQPIKGVYRYLRTAPVLFSPLNPHVLYYAGNVLFKTSTGGDSWEVISPDLTRESWDLPASIGRYKTEEMKKMPRRGVIYTVAPSPLDSLVIWAGTDDGLIHVTKDGGKTWTNVTPPEVTSWSKVSIIDAGHFDVNTAYAAVNRFRCDDLRPHIYKTTDGGMKWTEIVQGLSNDPINVVREDPVRKGLLYAGSERFVSVSFDDGLNWQSLRLNMPATSIRDLVIKDDDIVVGTHGRSFWILDNVTPLRQISSNGETRLFKPQKAVRVRWSMYTDTPLPPEEPAGENPPDGAMIDYYLANDAANVTLEIVDASGAVIRSFSSSDEPTEIPNVNFPLYWIRRQQILSGKKGAHRFLWDMHYAPLNVPPSYPISAIYKNTAPEATSPWVMPGSFKVRLTVAGKTYIETLHVTMDPRVKTSSEDLRRQHELSVTSYGIRKSMLEVLSGIESLQKQIRSLLLKTKDGVTGDLQRFDKRLDEYKKAARGPQWLDASASTVFSILEETDMPPTKAVDIEIVKLQKIHMDLMTHWKDIVTKEVSEINRGLSRAKLNFLKID